MSPLTQKRSATLACLLVLVLAALPSLAAGQTASASRATNLPKAPAFLGGLKVKPTGMQIISISHSFSETNLPTLIQGKPSGKTSLPLHWEKWNKTEAVVDAYIYDGTSPGYPATVTLSHPRAVEGEYVFTQLKSRGGGEGVRAKIYHQPGAGRGALEWAPVGAR